MHRDERPEVDSWMVRAVCNKNAIKELCQGNAGAKKYVAMYIEFMTCVENSI